MPTPERLEEAEVSSTQRQTLLEELKEAGHMHRLHITLMFGQMTVFLAASGILLQRILATDSGGDPIEPSLARTLAVVGFGISVVLLVHHERVYAYSRAARDRAVELQKSLGMALYRQQPLARWLPISASKASRTFYLLVTSLWLLLVLWPTLVT